MAPANSTWGKRPAKPYDGFPLRWHATGYWCKKIRGKLHYFGPRYGTWQEALEEYQRDRDDLHAGRKPRDRDDNAATVRYLCNAFLTDRKHRLEAGELTQRSFNDYHTTCQRLVDEFGAGRRVDDLKPAEFLELRSKLAEGWAPTTLGNEIQRIRVVFNFAFDAQLIDTPIRYGPSFKKPSRRVIRQYRQGKGKRLFSADQIRDLIDIAPTQIRAMILLGVNCGLGNRDIGLLEKRHIVDGWLDYPRPKTTVERRCPLWPETIVALRLVEKERNGHGPDHLIFATRHARPWSTDSKADPIAREFGKLLKVLDIYRPGLSFYALRHTFETIAGEAKDQVAVDAIMGHERSDMASVYREAISDERLEAVADHVRSWLFGEAG
jgi:integrase